MKEDNSNWFNLSSGDKVLFIGEAQFKYFATTHSEDAANNMKPFRFVVFDLLTGEFTTKANLQDKLRFKVVPFSSLNILKADGSAVTDAEVKA